jgi:hypothetical protein
VIGGAEPVPAWLTAQFRDYYRLLALWHFSAAPTLRTESKAFAHFGRSAMAQAGS